MRIAATIVTYNPELERLLENNQAIQPQVEHILIVDNGSENIELFDKLANISYTKSPENKGIAWALNHAFEWAKQNCFDWLLTLDQNSVVENRFVEKMKNAVLASNAHVGIAFPHFSDLKGEALVAREHPFIKRLRFVKRKLASFLSPVPITSGSLTNVRAAIDFGGIDKDYFIDNVDFEIDLKMLRMGYTLLPCKNAEMNQECGIPRLAQNSRLYISGHFVWRFYYMYRKRIWLHRYFFVAPLFFILDDFVYLAKIPLYCFYGEKRSSEACSLVCVTVFCTEFGVTKRLCTFFYNGRIKMCVCNANKYW